MHSLFTLAASALLAQTIHGQFIYSQNFTFNSSFSLTKEQIERNNMSTVEAHNFEIALNFERSNYAGGSVHTDPFYAVPKTFNPHDPPPPGTVLKVEEHTNTSLYTLPASLSMSRILYTSETLTGTSIPASAYILWPYTPRTFPNLTSKGNGTAFPVVGIAHGTSGQTAECAPSHFKALWDDFHEPFALALSGYIVIAPDYAGLGVSTIPSPYFVLPSQANDLAHAIKAAQSAFPTLSDQFVIMGQSQGGGVAWSFAQRQVTRPMQGYLGTVAVSPFTDILADIVADPQAEDNARVIGIAQGLDSVLSSFKLSDWVTELGISRHSLLLEVGGCGITAGTIVAPDAPLLKTGWNETDAAQWYRNVSDNGARPFAGPMLVLQGDMDGNANVNVTSKSVDETCKMFPEESLRYIEFRGIGHVPALYAGQHVWMDWIGDRFRGIEEDKCCVKEVKSPVTGVANGGGQNWVIEFDQYGL